MIHDYQLLKEIYHKSDRNLTEIDSHFKILDLLQSVNDKSKGYKLGYTGFVYLASDVDYIYYCTMENFWEATRDIECDFDFDCLDDDCKMRVQIRAKTRERALDEFFEVCGGGCSDFSATEEAFIFFPPKGFSRFDAIVTINNQNGIQNYPYEQDPDARNFDFPCSKFQYPEREYNDTRFYYEKEMADDYIDFTIRDLIAEFKKSNYVVSNGNFVNQFNRFIRSKKLIPSIEISKNHYILFEKEYAKDKQ